MEENKSALKRYHIEVTGLLTEMNKEEAIEFFTKYKFEKDDIYITKATDEDMELSYDYLEDELYDESESIIRDNEIEYSSEIIEDIKNLDDDTYIYATFDEDNYNTIYVQMMMEKILSNDGTNKNEVFKELCDSYLKYLELPITEKKDKLNTFEVFRSFTHSLNTFIDEFMNNKMFSVAIILSYNDLMKYYTKLEIKSYHEKYIGKNRISTINDIVRKHLMNMYTSILSKERNEFTTIKKMYEGVLNNKEDSHTNDYVKLLVINDAYIMSRVSNSKDFKNDIGMGIVLDTFNVLNQKELISLFDTNTNFGYKCCRHFVDFNTRSNYNISKSTLKKTYGDKKVLQKINRYHFLDYVSND